MVRSVVGVVCVLAVSLLSGSCATNNGGDRGGAISLFSSTVDVINNLFVENEVTGTGGGAIYASSVSGNACSASIVNNTFAYNTATAVSQYDGNGGAVLGYQDEYSTTDLAMVNNIFYSNLARDPYSGNSAACRNYATATLLFCGAFSGASDLPAYHYSGITPGDGSYCTLLGVNDPAMFTNDYHLAVPGPYYTPVDQGHDQGAMPYHRVPSDDRDGCPRPAGVCTDMGCYEAQ